MISKLLLCFGKCGTYRAFLPSAYSPAYEIPPAMGPMESAPSFLPGSRQLLNA